MELARSHLVVRSGNTRFDGMFEVPTSEGGPEPPEEALRAACEGVGASPQFRALLSPRTWSTSRADITHNGRLDEASHPENRPELYFVLYIMVIRAYLMNIQGDP